MNSRIASALKRPDVSGTGKSECARPAIALGFVFLSLAILTWPKILEKVVSLDWRLGHMRPVAYDVEAVLVALTLATVFAHKWVSSQFYRIFPSGKQLSIAAVTVLLSVGFSLIVAEGLLRLLHSPFQAKWNVSEDALARYDPELGWSYIPNQSVTQEFGEERRKVPMYFDNLGFRVQKPGDRADRSAPTVLLVGDSFTFGHGVSYEESFGGRLASLPAFPLQVVNLGVQGYGTDQSLLLLKRQFKNFNTKAVVYTFIPEHVNRNEYYDRRILHPLSLFLGTKPLFALKPDGSLYLAKVPVEYKDLSYSRLWACFEILGARWGPRLSVRLTRALIKEMKEYVEANGARFVVIDWYEDPEFPWGLDVDVIRPGANSPPGWPSWIIHGDGHPDPRAHLYVSELVAKELKRVTTNQGEVDESAHRVRAE